MRRKRMTNMKSVQAMVLPAIIIVIGILFVSAACCVDQGSQGPDQPGINNTTKCKCNLSDEWISGINVSTVPYLGSESIRTNASFVARIALCDKNVAEMIRHGGDIRGVVDFMPPRPKGWNKSPGPTLWVAFRGIDVYFYVNETREIVERYDIVIPGDLYRKERSENSTRLIDRNGTAVFAFNGSDIWFPELDTYDPVKSPAIGIDPAGARYYAGDRFTVSGNSTLSGGKEIIVRFYLNSYIHGIKARPDNTSVMVATRVVPGGSGLNRWSAAIDTTGFWPDEYIITAYSNNRPEINASRIIVLNNRDDSGE
jgi:hypothetical protein